MLPGRIPTEGSVTWQFDLIAARFLPHSILTYPDQFTLRIRDSFTAVNDPAWILYGRDPASIISS